MRRVGEMDTIQITINKSGIYKKCRACGELFPSHVLTINSYCSKHQKEFKRILERYIRDRLVPVETLDVFDKDGYRVCRSCGKPMYRKDGKRSHARRNCNEKDCGNLAYLFFEHYQMPSIISHLLHDRKEPDGFVHCGSCGRPCNNHISSYYERSIRPHIEIHHIKPVYKTTFETWEDVWDPENLIALCPDCHNRTKVYKVPVLKIPVVREKRITKQLTLFN
jgi:DNA-directed RNA polymerase subunit M/transcription elongation factor TFIIS